MPVVDRGFRWRRDAERSGCCKNGKLPKPPTSQTKSLSAHAYAFDRPASDSTVADEIRVHQRNASNACALISRVTKKPHLILTAGYAGPFARHCRCLHPARPQGCQFRSRVTYHLASHGRFKSKLHEINGLLSLLGFATEERTSPLSLQFHTRVSGDLHGTRRTPIPGQRI